MEENKKSLVFVLCVDKNYTQGIFTFAALFTALCAGF